MSLKNLIENIPTKMADNATSKLGEWGELLQEAVAQGVGFGLKDGNLEIKLTEEFLNSQLEKSSVKGIETLKVEIREEDFSVHVKLGKLGLNQSVELVLKPAEVQDRRLIFDAVFKPAIAAQFSKMITWPQLVQYQDNKFYLDLDAIESLRKVPFGTIKDFYIKRNKLRVVVGI